MDPETDFQTRRHEQRYSLENYVEWVNLIIDNYDRNEVEWVNLIIDNYDRNEADLERRLELSEAMLAFVRAQTDTLAALRKVIDNL